MNPLVLITRPIHTIRRIFNLLVMYAAAGIAILRQQRNFVLQRYEGGRTLTGAARVAVFVHFDTRGRVHDFVVYYLQALRNAGFELVFVSNSPRLPSSAIADILPLCAAVLHRKNIGYDFGAYKDGLAALGDLSQYNEVLLANDSVYGPLFDLNDILSQCNDSAAVWGMTDSWDRRYHLQSYFVLFKKAALVHPNMQAFWSSVIPAQSKTWIIRKYEIGLTQALMRGGLPCTALYKYRSATAAFIQPRLPSDMPAHRVMRDNQRKYITAITGTIEGGGPLNIMHHLWEQILRMGCPFIKRELLAKNPMGVPTAHQWQKTIEAVSDYDTDLIVRHLEATLRNRVI